MGSVVVGVGLRDRLAQKVGGAARRCDAYERARRLLEVEAIGEIVGAKVGRIQGFQVRSCVSRNFRMLPNSCC